VLFVRRRRSNKGELFSRIGIIDDLQNQSLYTKEMSELLKSVFVKKFGGTSVGSIERIEHVADLVLQGIKDSQKPIVVVSAMAGETNRLVRLANDIYPNFRGPAYDALLASGEQVSMSLLAMALEKRGVKTESFLGFQLGIQTDSIYSRARIQSINTEKLIDCLERNIVPIVAGFQGVDSQLRLTTLGRGGSDTTAVALSAALPGSVCEIYTDVSGVYTTDPRIVKKAQKIKELSFDEMMEMASLGSKVLHFRCVEIAAKYNTPIHVRSAFEDVEGTWILPEEKIMENPVVSSVTNEMQTAIVKIYPIPTSVHFLSDFFSQLSEKEIVVDIISQSIMDEGQRLAFSIPQTDWALASDLVKKLSGSKAQIQCLEDMAKVSIIGVGMRNHSGVAARFFSVLAKLNLAPQLVTTSDIKISAVVPESKAHEVVIALHTEFGLDG
jgi:aspartate kinase